MKNKISCGIISLVTVAIFKFSGCTLVCCAGGAISDSRKPSAVNIPGWELETIKPGAEIGIILRDGTKVSGKYEGLYSIPHNEYSERYNKMQKQITHITLPSLGDNITVTLTNGKQIEYELLGFDYDCILVRMIEINKSGELDPNIVSKIIDSHGNVIKGETLKYLMYEGKIPYLSVIIVKNGMKKIMVAFEDVNQIQKKIKKKGAITGLLLGAAIDGLIVAGSLIYIWGRFSTMNKY